jgi:hypothetical protein
MIDLLVLENRQAILKDIRSLENVKRKSESFADYEFMKDRLYPYVRDELVCQLGEKSVAQIPIVSTLNVGKYVVKNEATIYTDCPERTIENANDTDVKAVEDLYEKQQFDSKLQKSNQWFKYRGQSMLQVLLKNKALQLRVVLAHNLDVVPDDVDPTIAQVVILSTFDKAQYLKAGQDNNNQNIADPDDYKKSLERYVVWSAEYNFIMDGNGKVIDSIVPNPIGKLPFVDISKDKDYEFFERVGQLLSQFTLQYNVAWSDALYVNRMQGFSVGVLTGDPNLKPESITIAPAKLLFLPTNPNNENSKLTLDFKNPTPNIEASLKVIEKLLASFLLMRGVESKKISSALSGGSSSYSSAIERLLAMVDEFQATKEDFSLYQMVEQELFDIVKKFLLAYSGSGLLDKQYEVSQSFASAELSVNFHEPQMIETKTEKLANAKSKIDLGIADSVSTLMEIDGVSEDEAIKQIDDIRQRKAQGLLDSVPLTKDVKVEQTQITNGQ